MLEVLHITAHMGGGVGKVLSSIAAYSKNNDTRYKHKIIMLEEPEKNNFIEICISNNVEIIYSSDLCFIQTQMHKADIIQVEWWHHPIIAQFLHTFPDFPLRLVIWSHISGCSYPALPFEFIKVPHCFMFTSKYSLDNPLWNEQQKDYANENTQVINSSGGFENIPALVKMEHSSFNIGYCGTLSYSKLHPGFVEYSSNIDIPNAQFILVGDDTNKIDIQNKAEQRNILNKFQFTGYTNDVYKQLSLFDIFAYPLNPYHFGTTENAILEAMAVGLPVVALNQCAERYLIEHMHTGLLANSKEHYAQLIRYLYDNPTERKRLGENAKKYVQSTFSIENTIKNLNMVYDNVMNMPKKSLNFSHIFGYKPFEWFLACLGTDRKLFENSINKEIMSNRENADQITLEIINCRHILKELSKSSIYQFSKYFPRDSFIIYWKSLIDKRGD